jgi:ketosteroid isomerase-like protein
MTGADEIRELVSGQVAAMRSRDAAWLVARLTPDAVTFTLAPPLWNGPQRTHDEAALRAWFDTFDGPVDYEVRELRVECDGDVAFCYSLNRLSATPRGRSAGFDLWFRSTVCWRRVAGRWLVAHEHTSTPFYMDGSFRASVDLGPEVA